MTFSFGPVQPGDDHCSGRVTIYTLVGTERTHLGYMERIDAATGTYYQLSTPQLMAGTKELLLDELLKVMEANPPFG